MRPFLIVILGMMFLACPAWAQEDYIGTATSALQDVLATLKQSVEKLTLDNDQLTARDNAMKQHVQELQAQMGSLQAQWDLLNKTAAQSRGNNPHRSQQIAHLEQENSDLDDHIQKTQADIKLIQQSLASPHPEFQADARRQKEKLKLMKMIYDSQQRQESLHDAIVEFQKKAPVPAPTPNSGLAGQWDDTQLRQLELELKALEKNYSQLKDLMAQMDRKAKNTRMTVSQHIEGEKLQHTIDDFNRQSVGLSNDLEDLRSQMIDLDKRKSHLETMIQHSL